MSNYIENLPTEVLDRIIGYALEYHGAVPESPSDTDEARVAWPRDYHDCRSWDYGHSHVKYLENQELQYSTWSSIALVSRRFAAVVKSATERASSSPHLLDVMLVREAELWPTWTYVPGPTLRVDNLRVTFRIFPFPGDAKARKRNWWSTWYPGDGGPPQIEWCFYYLLEHFLESGALAEHKRPQGRSFSRRNGATINNLTLDFVDFVSPVDEDDAIPEDREQAREASDDEDYSDGPSSWEGRKSKPVSADWLARYVGGEIRSLLGMGYDEAFFGKILHERVGRVTICVDGNVSKEYRIDRILKDLEFTNPKYTWGHVIDHDKRIPAFRKWKEAAYRMREKAGLPVIH